MRLVTLLGFVVTLLSLFIQQSTAYNALFIGPVGTPSHKNFYMGIIGELVAEGHHVTLVTPFASKGTKANVREVCVPEGDINLMSGNRFQGPSFPGPLKVMEFYQACIATLERPTIQELVKEKFDVVFLSTIASECYMGVIYQLQVPFIYVSPLGLTSPQGEVIGNPTFPSIVPSPLFDFRHPLTFVQRTISTLMEVFGNTFINIVQMKLTEWDCHQKGVCPKDMPPFREIQQNVSLVFLNSVRQLEVPAIPYVSGVVHLGGIHCRPAEPLPEDLEEWVNGAGDHGFIFFSLGSTIKPSDLPEKDRLILVKVFGSLKQRVLWKWDKDFMTGMPANVRISKWLPQQDILGHPKLRLFITHGGLLSTLESIYHRKPILGMPVFLDQMTNMKKVSQEGYGKSLRWDDLTEDLLFNEINTIMNSENVHKRIFDARSTNVPSVTGHLLDRLRHPL